MTGKRKKNKKTEGQISAIRGKGEKINLRIRSSESAVKSGTDVSVLGPGEKEG